MQKKIPPFAIYKMCIGDCLVTATIDRCFSYSSYGASTPSLAHFHTHQSKELYIVEKNHITVHSPDRVTRFDAGVVCVGEDLSHYVSREPSTFRIVFSLKPNTLAEQRNDFTKLSALFGQELTVLQCSDSVFFYCHRILDLHRTPTPLNQEKVESLLKLIFLDLYTSNTEQKESILLNNDTVIQLEQYLFNHYAEEITLQMLADLFYLSTKQMARILKKNFHKSLAEILNERRMAVAVSLLLETDLPVGRIVEKAGYRTENYFFAQFKRFYHCTPLQYRKSFKKT